MSALSLRTRGLALILALVLAALATLALVSYLRGLEDRAYAGVETVEVFVAKEDIEEGTLAEDALARGAIQRTRVPRKVLAAGAIRNLAEIQGKLATVRIIAGEQLIAARFGAELASQGLLPIPDGMHAMTVQVNVPNGVGGFVLPGDRVSVIAKLDVPSGEAARISGSVDGRAVDLRAEGGTTSAARFLVQNVQVLAVNEDVQGVVVPAQDGEEEDKESPQQQQALLLTLAVSPEDAERITFATLEGQLYFTLVDKDADAAKTPGRTQTNIFR